MRVSLFFCLSARAARRRQLASSRTPFAALTPAPSTVSCVPLRGTCLRRTLPTARVRGWTRLSEASSDRSAAP